MKPSTNNALHVILAQRIWQAGSGFITIVVMTSFLDTTQQGWYYGLLSLAAFYTLFDFGLSLVLVQVAARSFVGMQWRGNGAIEGAQSERFAALTAWSGRHYLWLALIVAALITPAGFLFFSQKTSDGIFWRLPWLVLALTSAATLFVVPFTAVLEGSGKVREVYAVRLVQGVVGAVACWITFIVGGGLWAVVMAPLAAIVIQGIWLTRNKPALLSSAWLGNPRAIHWRQDIWPHQWQLGLGLIGGYLLTQIYTPILFIAQSAVVAGQMGLTLTVSNMLGLLALSWITRHVPAMANAVASGERNRFEALCRRDLVLSSLAFFGGMLVLCGLHPMIDKSAYAERLLPFWVFVGVLAAGFFSHVQNVMAAQLRSFGREPLLWTYLGGAVLTAAAAVWSAVYYSVNGIVVAMLAVQVVITMPASLVIWRRCIRDWRAPSIINDTVSANP